MNEEILRKIKTMLKNPFEPDIPVEWMGREVEIRYLSDNRLEEILCVSKLFSSHKGLQCVKRWFLWTLRKDSIFLRRRALHNMIETYERAYYSINTEYFEKIYEVVTSING